MQNKAEEPAATAYVSQLKAPRRQPALLKSVPWCGGISALQTSHPSLPAFLLSLLLVLLLIFLPSFLGGFPAHNGGHSYG